MKTLPTVTGVDRTAVEETAARLRKQFLGDFDPAYVENVILPFFLIGMYQGETLSLPMIGLQLTKENALPPHLWGLLSDKWTALPEDGVTVFLQRFEERGPHNLRKKIYMSAVTPDLYRPMYHDKVVRFFDRLLDAANAGKPLMRRYLDDYFDLYWDLHLGVTGDAIPPQVRQIGHSFNTVLAYRDPTQQIVYDNYMTVRSQVGFLKQWIDDRISDLIEGRTADPEKTFVHYWIKNGDEGGVFQHRDVVFECFHNFVAFSQWGNTLYNIMLTLARDSGDPEARDWFRKTMAGQYDRPDRAAFTPLQRFVMELFRTISPNAGSISALDEVRPPPYPRHGYILTPHLATSLDPRHWRNPRAFDPDRYTAVPASDEIDETGCELTGLASCPFERAAFDVKDGRDAALHNSGFGTVFGVVDGQSWPVCDYAGYAPFGFGYRRCPGEQLTIEVFADFLREVWASQTEFEGLNIADPERLPVGPGTVIGDNVGFSRAT